MQKRPKHFFVFYFMASWNVDVKYVFVSNWIHLDPLPRARKLSWLRSRVHAGKILHQIQKRTEPYGSTLACTGPKWSLFRIRFLRSVKIQGQTSRKLLFLGMGHACQSGRRIRMSI